MTQHSKSRQQAESAFTKVQSPFLARNRAFEELDAIAKTREDKTTRLKNARLAKEADDLARATAHRRGAAADAKAALLKSCRAAEEAAEPTWLARQEERMAVAVAPEERRTERDA